MHERRLKKGNVNVLLVFCFQAEALYFTEPELETKVSPQSNEHYTSRTRTQTQKNESKKRKNLGI